jgi:Flp pilus assembly protein TadD
LNRDDEAIVEARRIQELAPENPGPRMLLASLYANLGRWEEAASEYQQLVNQGAPIEASIGLARAELERGRSREAVTILDGVLLSSPQSYEALVLHGRAKFLESDYAAALASFQQSRVNAKEIKDREAVLFHLGQCLERLNRFDEAKAINVELRTLQDAKMLLLAGTQRSDDIELQVRVAEACVAAGIPEEAVRVLDQSMARSGRSRKLLRTTAACYEKVGRTDEARQLRLEAERLP